MGVICYFETAGVIICAFRNKPDYSLWQAGTKKAISVEPELVWQLNLVVVHIMSGCRGRQSLETEAELKCYFQRVYLALARMC